MPGFGSKVAAENRMERFALAATAAVILLFLQNVDKSGGKDQNDTTKSKPHKMKRKAAPGSSKIPPPAPQTPVRPPDPTEPTGKAPPAATPPNKP